MESRETMRALPILQLFRLPSRQSCATRAVLTPSISAVSEAVAAGTSESSTLTARVTTVSQSKSNNGYTPRKARTTLRRPNLAKLLCKILDFLQSYFARFATNDMQPTC